MMEVEVPYGDGTLSARFPDYVSTSIIEPNEVPQKDEIGLLKEAISNPVSCEPLSEFLGHPDKVLVVVNDATRQTPTSKALEGMDEALRDKKLEFLIATGSHRAPTESEIRSIFGTFYSRYRDCIQYHDSRESETIELGVTSRGTPVKINRMLFDFERVVLINSVEPHYFAGFTGGRKSILPGIASFETIEANHKFALEPRARTLSLEGNPVHEDMVEALGFLDSAKLFSTNLVLDGHRRISSVGAGDIDESFLEAVRYSRDIHSVQVERPADIVITVASPPSDLNLYQSQKALDNAKLVTKEGGTIVFITECREGIGKREFFDLIAAEKDPASVLGKIKSGYRLGWHKAAKMAEMLTQFEILAVSDLPPADIENLFMVPFSGLQSAVDHSLESLDEDVHALVMPMGELTVPRVQEG
ncbi:MAG: nickel-dependent lactate racemase [Thermoplasmata archaeon]